MDGSASGMLVFRVALGAALLVSGLGATAASAQEARPCDPTRSLCILDTGPWTSPQELRLSGPAGTRGLEVNWRRGYDEHGGAAIRVERADAATMSWRATLPAGIEPGRLTVVATTNDPELAASAQGPIRPRTSREELRIVRSAGQRVARADLRTRAPVRVRVELRLWARYPAERYRKLRTWRLDEMTSGEGSRRLSVRTGKLKRRCRAFAACKLRARMKVRSLGYALERGKAKGSVRTPPERPRGSLRFVPGNADSDGAGRRYDYSVHVERGIKVDRKGFAADLADTLGHRRGWTRGGSVRFRQVESAGAADTRLILAGPRLVDRLCAPLATRGYVSCTQGSTVVLNLNRWRHAVPHWNRSRRSYRRMLVNHEIGHRLGLGHRSCSGSGRRAPVMQQQTYGLGGCKANPWPLRSELRSARSYKPPKSR